MLNLIKNELIKVFKRKNIYILLFIGIIIIIGYNIFQRIINSNVDISKQYQRAYTNDKLYLENYDQLNIKDTREEIEERLALEKYAIDNDIKYNILLNSENNNSQMPSDARILLMKVFNNFDIIIVCILIYLASTIISEELGSGTIKNVLSKPHTRTKILFSKIITNILIVIGIVSLIVIFQYILGGLLFGFDSYSLEAIRYNNYTKMIERTNLVKYIIILVLSKMPMYLLITGISLLFGLITNNMALNILISLGIYLISKLEILINNFTKYIFIYNWDISKYLYSANDAIIQATSISFISLVIIFIILIIGFKNKDIKNI